MSSRPDISAPAELVYRPRPSWAPLFFALGAVGMVCGIYAEGFAVRAWIFAIAGAIVFLGALRSLVRGAARAYFSLPRRQRVRGAVLPVQPISPPSRD